MLSLNGLMEWLDKHPTLATWFAGCGQWAAAIATLAAVRVALFQDPRAKLKIQSDPNMGPLFHHEKTIAFPPSVPPPEHWIGQAGLPVHFFLVSVRNVGRGKAIGVQVQVVMIKNIDTGRSLLQEDKPSPYLRWAHSWWLFADVGKTLDDAPHSNPILPRDIAAGSATLCDVGFVVGSNGHTQTVGFPPGVFMLAAEKLPFLPALDSGRWIIRMEAVAANATPCTLDLYLCIDWMRAGSTVPDRVKLQPVPFTLRIRNRLADLLR